MRLSDFLDLYLSGPLAFLPSENRRPWRAQFDMDQASQSLNGLWDFAYFSSYQDLPFELSSKDGKFIFPVGELNLEDQAAWPGQWELQGYGKPKYINQDYEWAKDLGDLKPPYIPPEFIRAGIYQKTFKFALQGGERAILRLDGFEAAVWLFLDGEFFGYSNQGKNRNEFVLPYDPETANEEHCLTILMTSLSSGSWMECQDMWRLSGPIRDISIVAVPEIELFDVRLDSQIDLDQEMTQADLFAEVKLWNHGKNLAPAQTVRVVLEDQGEVLAEGTGFTGNLSYRFEEKRFIEKPEAVESNVLATAYVKLSDLKPKLWHPETPQLYQVRVELMDSKQEARTHYGFRQVASQEGVFLLNGQPLKVQGVNRHEFDSKRGRAVLPTQAEEDLRLMKSHNLNAVRVAHYPARSELYDQADRLGMLVMDEANLESHGISYRRNILPGNDARWYPMALDRVSAIFETHKNHPSIFSWSIGNELGWGEVVQEMAAYLQAKEDGRLIHKRQMNKVADFNSENYGRPEFFETFGLDPELNHKIFLSTEYAHAMGNAMGDIARYVEVFRSYDNLAGGFVWEWCDHALEDDQGRPVYGGHFGEVMHDGNFCIDGVTTSGRERTEKLQALAHAWSYFAFDWSSEALTIQSRLQVLTADRLQIELLWQANGCLLHEETLACPPLKPRQKVRIPLDPPDLPEQAEIYVTARLKLREETTVEDFWTLSTACDPTLEAGQFRYQAAEITTTEHKTAQGSKLQAFQEVAPMHFRSASGLDLIFDEAGSVQIGDRVKSLDLSLARAATDNDRRSRDFLGLEGVHRGWQQANLHALCWQREEGPYLDEGEVVLVRTLLLAGERWQRFSQRFSLKDESLAVHCKLQRLSGEVMPLPRVGLQFQPVDLPETYWYGGGAEAYSDRQGRNLIDLYQASQEELFNASYLKPQENGHHDSLRYLALGNEGHVGLSLYFDRCFSFNRQPWSTKVLEDTPYVWQLEDKEKTDTVYIDLEHAGLGNSSCGPETAPWNKLTEDSYAWSCYFDLSNQGRAEDFASRWQWPSTLAYRDFAEHLTERDLAGSDFREQLASRGESQYRDPSDRDVRLAQGFQQLT